MAFKICTSCTKQYQKPISINKRVCPQCGAKGQFAFRAPTNEELTNEANRRAKAEAKLQELLNDNGKHHA